MAQLDHGGSAAAGAASNAETLTTQHSTTLAAEEDLAQSAKTLGGLADSSKHGSLAAHKNGVDSAAA